MQLCRSITSWMFRNFSLQVCMCFGEDRLIWCPTTFFLSDPRSFHLLFFVPGEIYPFAVDFIYYWYPETLASARKQKQYAATKKRIALQIRSSIAPKKASFKFPCSFMHPPLNQTSHQVPHVNDHFWIVDPFSPNLFSKISRFPTPFSPPIPHCYHFLTTTSNLLTFTPQLRKFQRHNLVDLWFTSSLNTQHAWLQDSPSAGGRGDDVYFSGFFSLKAERN